MACRKGWSREILVDNFTQKFVTTTYKRRRENLLYEREKSLMPSTQPYVEIEKKIRELSKEVVFVEAAHSRASELMHKINSRALAVVAVENNLTSEFDASIIRQKQVNEQRKVVSSLTIDLQHLEWHKSFLIHNLHGGTIVERRQFVRACPVTDCRGFLSTAWKCGMCENWSCPDCHEVKGKDKDAPHTCDPNSVATAQLLARDSRNCPKCAAGIFKIDGCDQMWCTQCHTAFSWRTGRIETHTVHNPHYYEYMRARGPLARNPGDVPCGGFPDLAAVSRVVPRNSLLWNRIAAAHRSYTHCQWALIPRYEVNIREDNRDLRIKFMIGDFTDDEFKKKIQQREKARQRKTDIRQVVAMYIEVLNDLFQALVQTKDVGALADSLQELRSHVNTTLDAVSKRYTKCSVPRITENYDFL
jgi:ribosomal protein S27AE